MIRQKNFPVLKSLRNSLVPYQPPLILANISSKTGVQVTILFSIFTVAFLRLTVGRKFVPYLPDVDKQYFPKWKTDASPLPKAKILIAKRDKITQHNRQQQWQWHNAVQLFMKQQKMDEQLFINTWILASKNYTPSKKFRKVSNKGIYIRQTLLKQFQQNSPRGIDTFF